MCAAVAGGGLLGVACVAEGASQDPPASTASLEAADAVEEAERIGEAQSTSAAGDACVAACAASYAALCVQVRNLCATAEIVTIGGATVPCVTAVSLACIGGAALAAVCGRRCPP